MDKVKKFLEAYVQWLAMALGVGFLGWMIYSYVVVKPVKSAVGSDSEVPPSEINSTIWSEVGEPLQTKLHDRTPPPPMGPTHDFSADAIAKLSAVSPSVVAVTPTPFTPIPLPEDVDQETDLGKTHQTAKITSLPTAPALTDLQVSGGHSNVPAPQPAAAAGAPPAPQGNAVAAVDRNWRTVAGTFHSAYLAKAFAKAGIAPGSTFSNTAILRVVLTRQERKTDGSWGSETTIDPLDINPLPPLPPIDASFADQKSYLEDFAEKNFIPIARPPFYQVLQGDAWYEPGTPNPKDAQEVVDDGYDPKDPGAYAGDLTKLLPSEQKLVTEAKARAAAKEAQRARYQSSHQQSAPPPPLPGAAGADAPQPAVDDPLRPAGGQPLDPAPLPGDGSAPPPMPPSDQQNSTTALPAGSFDPSQQPDFKVWVHDPTVQAGKTYRYQLKYIISNPVARTSNLCNPPELAKQFYIESAPSAWTAPVSVESDTNFFAVDLKHGIEFNVFKWKDGIWQMQDTTANIGDMIGSIQSNPTTGGSKTDFTTGWTLVDIREDPTNSDNRELVLVSNNGTVLIKQLTSDAHSPEYRKLYLQATDPKNHPAMAGATPQG